MGQKYPTNKEPYTSEIIETSLWKCCVGSSGKRKKVWDSEQEAWSKAKEYGMGVVYECWFNPHTYHITTHPHNEQLKKERAEAKNALTLIVTQRNDKRKEIASLGVATEQLVLEYKSLKEQEKQLYKKIARYDSVIKYRHKDNKRIHQARFGRSKKRLY